MSFDSGTSPCEKAWHSWHSRDLRLLLISVFQPFDGRSAAAANPHKARAREPTS